MKWFLIPDILVLIAIIGIVFYSRIETQGFERKGRIFVVPDGEATRVSVHLIFQQSGYPAGLAHYTEHLTWLSAINLDRSTQQRDSNAWTAPTTITYWLEGPKEELGGIIDRLSGVLRPISLDRAFADEERGIIQREYDRSIATNLSNRVGEAMAAFLHAGNPFGTSVIGTRDEIARFDYGAAARLHDEAHRAENAVLLVTGGATLAQVEAALPGSLKALAAGGPSPLAPLTIGPPETRVIPFPDASAAPLLRWGRVVTLERPVDFDRLDVTCGLLRDMLVSDLPGGLAGPLRFDHADAASFSVDVSALDETHVALDFNANPDRGVSLARLRSRFEEVLAANAGAGIPASSFERITERLRKARPDWGKARERTDWLETYVEGRLMQGRVPLAVDAFRPIDSQITVEDINALLAGLAAPGRTAIAYVGPEENTP